MEPTIAPGFKNDELNNGGLPTNWLTPSIHPSIIAHDDDFVEHRAPIGFVAVANAVNDALIAIGLADPTTFVTETKTKTKTTIKTTTTSTKTFYLSGCRPSPFPFTECP